MRGRKRSLRELKSFKCVFSRNNVFENSVHSNNFHPIVLKFLWDVNNTRTTKGGQNDLFDMVGSRYTSIVGSSSDKYILYGLS